MSIENVSGSDERDLRQQHAHPRQVRKRGLRENQQVTNPNLKKKHWGEGH